MPSVIPLQRTAFDETAEDNSVSVAQHQKGLILPSATGAADGKSMIGLFAVLLLALSAGLVLVFARAVDTWTWAAWAALPLMAANALWISGGAATSMLGLIAPGKPLPKVPDSWRPQNKTAVLITLCGENPELVAHYLDQLHRGLAGLGLDQTTRIFVLSDTSGVVACAREDAGFVDILSKDHVFFRRRTVRTNKKPGNISDWLHTYGEAYDHMVVLDADSRMSPSAIQHLLWAMETNPKLGLLQAGIGLVPGRTRFGKYQRITSRLLSKTFGHGFAAWSGETGNYWGHNAIIRVEAFRACAQLPRLSGTAPFGGPILSHDFIEAAWIRRAGWTVELCPGLPGSAEDAPQTLSEFSKRDRRWCQGNLQHLRLLAEPGLHAISRFHLVSGIFSYLTAPIWLVVLALLSSGLISVWGFLPVLSIAAVLLIPKVCALIEMLPRARTSLRRRLIWRAWWSELVLSTALAPIIMLRQAAFVGSILMGRDCGWKSKETKRFSLPLGWPEAGLGLGLLALTFVNQTTGAFWLALIILPLISAPVLLPKLNEVPR